MTTKPKQVKMWGVWCKKYGVIGRTLTQKLTDAKKDVKEINDFYPENNYQIIKGMFVYKIKEIK